jgi:hypothetical protein
VAQPWRAGIDAICGTGRAVELFNGGADSASERQVNGGARCVNGRPQLHAELVLSVLDSIAGFHGIDEHTTIV